MDAIQDWSQSHPDPTDFDSFLPWACTQLSVEAKIVITRTSMSEYVSVVTSDRHKTRRKPKNKSATTTESTSAISLSSNDMISLVAVGFEHKIYIETTYDHNLNLVQIKFGKNKTIPWQVMKIIGLIIPYHKHLTSLTVHSGLRMESIYHISKFLPISRITELCFDYTYLIEANYHILLDQSSLKHLSLSKCKLDDAVIKTIALKLVHPYAAAKTLAILNLATNRITDIGVKYLAEALRSNRHLSYLNLADNLITDIGASSILDILVEFPLTREESFNKRARHMMYLKDKLELVVKTIKDLRTGDFEKKAIRRRSVKSAAVTAIQKKSKPDKDISITGNMNKSLGNVDTALYERAETIVEGILGPFIDPYDSSNTVIRDGIVYCYGNNTLCYLNMAYNNLTFASIKKLHEVVVTQKLVCRKPKGLVNVRIDGNFLPAVCSELLDIDYLLETGLASVRRLSNNKKKPGVRTGPSKSISH